MALCRCPCLIDKPWVLCRRHPHNYDHQENRGFIMQKFISLVFFGLLLFVAIPVSQAQGGPRPETIAAVQDYFQTQYGSDYALLRYTWRAETWEDTSLGCPKMGFAYEAQTISGYVWQLTLSDNTTYELHSNEDASQVVFCSTLDRSGTTEFSVYQNLDFVMDIPQEWNVTENADLQLVTVSPNGEENCQDVGMQVQFLPVIGNAQTMLDTALQQAGFVQNIGVRVTIGDDPDTLALGFQAPCGNNLLQYRIGAFPNLYTGSGYLLIQWTPLESYSQWSLVYDRILQSFRLTDTLESIPQATADTPPELAFGDYPFGHVFVQDVYIGSFNTLPGQAITVGSSRPRGGLKFSSDGRYLAYVDLDPFDGSYRLEVAGTNLRRTPIGNPLAPYFPPTWSLNEFSVAYLELGVDSQLNVQATNPLNPSTPQFLGTVPFDTTTCDLSTPSYLPEQLYWQETGPAGNAFMFEQLLDGQFLFTTHCDGLGLSIWNPVDNSIVNLGDDLYRAVLNPNRTHLAAFGADGNVYTISLTSAERTLVPFEVQGDQIGWSAEGRFLYISSLQPIDTIYTLDDASNEEEVISTFGMFPYTTQNNNISIVEFDLGRGTSRTIWESTGYAIGRMITAPNNGGLIFSLVPSDEAWVVAYLQQQDTLRVRYARPETELHWVSPATGNARRLAISSYPVVAYSVPTTE